MSQAHMSDLLQRAIDLLDQLMSSAADHQHAGELVKLRQLLMDTLSVVTNGPPQNSFMKYGDLLLRVVDEIKCFIQLFGS
jgi:hypothetical protein